MSEQSIHGRMVSILAELPAIGKNQKNTQQGFMFRGHDDILNALNPLLAKHGVIILPQVEERVTAQRATAKGGVMYEVNLRVRYVFWGADGSWIEATTWGEGTDTGDKATNKAMTMAFKNVLNQTFAISSAEFKDADAETPPATRGRQETSRKPSAAEKPAQPGTLKLLAETVAALQQGFPSPDQTHKYSNDVKADIKDLGKKNSSELTEQEAQSLVLKYEKRLIEAKQADEIPFGDAA